MDKKLNFTIVEYLEKISKELSIISKMMKNNKITSPKDININFDFEKHVTVVINDVPINIQEYTDSYSFGKYHNLKIILKNCNDVNIWRRLKDKTQTIQIWKDGSLLIAQITSAEFAGVELFNNHLALNFTYSENALNAEF